MEFFLNRLASVNLLRQFAIFLAVFRTANCLTYHPGHDMCEGYDVQVKCEETKGRGARISDANGLRNAFDVIQDMEEYWTGLSWHHRHNFCWYTSKNRPVALKESFVNLNNTWFCFLVRKNQDTLIVERCDKMHKYLCEQASPSISSMGYYPMNDTCAGNQVQQKCAASGHGRRGAGIRDKDSLRKARDAISDNKEYWIGISWHPIHKFRWNQNQSVKVEDDIFLPSGKRWFCFLISKSTASTLVARRCDESHYYICEQNTTVSLEPETTDGIKTTLTASYGLPTSEVVKLAGSTTEPTPLYETMATTKTSPITTVPLALTVTGTEATGTTSWKEEPSSTTSQLTTNDATKATATASPPISDTVYRATTILPPPPPPPPPSTTTTTTATTTTSQSDDNVFSNKIRETSFINGKVALTPLTVRVQSSITGASNNYNSSKNEYIAREKLKNYISKLKDLNVTRKDSLQNATDTASNLFKGLKQLKTIKKNSINVLLATQELESFAMKYGRLHYKENESTIISQEYYSMKIQRIPARSKDAVVFSINEANYSADKGWASISLPSAMFQGKDAVAVCIVYNDIKQWFPDEDRVEVDDKTLTNLELRSRIIAGSVNPRPAGILEENVTISFSYHKEANEEDRPHCLFWDFSIKSNFNGSWSRKGCSMVRKVNNEIICTCNHLTNFAVLMQVGANKQISSDHRVALQVITYIGCVLSLTGEVLTILAYCALMNLKQEQIQIRLNLVVAIAIAQIAFLSGIDASETKSVCVFVAALIHFFYLAGFVWMLFEGVYLYLMVVKVFNTEIRMRVFYAVAWGTPVVIVALSIVLASSQDGGVQSYVHGNFCWVSFANNLVWTFVAPVLVVCLVNSVLLGLVVHEILKMQSPKTSEVESLQQAAKACVVLFPLLGMTWVFGVLSVTDAGLAFQYIFTILNSLQVDLFS